MVFFLPKKEKELKSWTIVLFIGILCVSLILAIFNGKKEVEPVQEKISIIINEQTCSDSGGDWNICASACRGDSENPCIQSCVEVCECEQDLDCPFEFSCQDSVEGIGVCKKQL